MALNDIDAAVESFKKAVELEPNDGQEFLTFFYINFVIIFEVNGKLKCSWIISRVQA